MTTTFLELGLKPELISALEARSITEPTAIQAAAIPVLLQRRTSYLQAETGTGKTLAYLLPIFATLDPMSKHAHTIIIAPTHELAIQIQRQCTDLSQLSGLPIRVLLLIGGTSKDRQLEKLKKKPHIIVGSLGRIRELIEAKKLKSPYVKTVVIDEADRVLTSESLADLEHIIKSTSKERNIIFVSATQSPDAERLVVQMAPETVTINTAFATPVNSNLTHVYLVCEAREKSDYIRRLMHALTPRCAIVFMHKSHEAELLTSKLLHQKLNAIDIHGTLSKQNRKKSMDLVRSGKVEILIASDLAARGLDIAGVTHVINFDIPTLSDAYLHRAGRTGRAGAKGLTISLITDNERYLIGRFTKDLGITLNETTLHNGVLSTIF
jgi:ATP-dependent RNA helicase DeaD